LVDPERHADSRNLVESILRHIPGFHGYLEREYRRESDNLARNWLADQLKRCKASLDNYQRSLIDAGQIDALPQCERVRTRLDTLESRIRGAVRGYSGLFDFVRVNEDLLDQVYELDTSLIGDIETLAQSVDQLGVSDSPQDAISDLIQQVETLHRQFDERAELLQGLGCEE